MSGKTRRMPRGGTVVLAGVLAGPAAVAAQDLRVTLERGAVVAADGSRVDVRWTITNAGSRTAQLLRWQTPLEGLRSNMFTVRCNGQEVPYLGPLVKRSRPSAADYVALPAGRPRSAILDLAGAYAFRGPTCTIEWRGRLLDVVDGAAPPAAGARRAWRRVELQSETITVDVAPDGAGAGANVGCSGQQATILAGALAAAGPLATQAQQYLNGVPVGSRATNARYVTWFGAYDATRYTGVAALYGNIAGAATGQVDFDCTGAGRCNGVPVSCDPGDYAFTCASGTTTIWPCAAFWTAPATGEDSKPGTIVHELSHWFGTDDYEYGCSDCQALANRNANRAVNNADNCQYFAENFGLTCG